MAASSGAVRFEAETILFGFPSTPAVLFVRPRTASWRVGGAVARMGGFAVLATVVALVPPHAPWLIGALVCGVILARRRWIERYTLESLEGICPKCSEALKLKSGRLRSPHPAPCEGCHHESSISLDMGALEALAT
jgi:hypothetical protein